jgi:hypothetical protein
MNVLLLMKLFRANQYKLLLWRFGFFFVFIFYFVKNQWLTLDILPTNAEKCIVINYILSKINWQESIHGNEAILVYILVCQTHLLCYSRENVSQPSGFTQPPGKSGVQCAGFGKKQLPLLKQELLTTNVEKTCLLHEHGAALAVTVALASGRPSCANTTFQDDSLSEQLSLAVMEEPITGTKSPVKCTCLSRYLRHTAAMFL